MKDNEYIYIGSEIFSFNTIDKIIDYVSPVGNNDVPYPYAIDNNGNYYLLIENVILKGEIKYEDPYNYYYEHANITTDHGRIPPGNTTIKNFNDIDEFYIGKDRYTLRYVTFPEKNYDRLLKSFGGPLYVKYVDGTKKELSKNDYVELMRSYGKVKNFVPFTTKKLQDRDIGGTFLNEYMSAISGVMQ
uniref:Uncharacterized protein n=1 Tax=viral metagenome TaxID=1070528 RepID=A0A6C0C961_9ZZZZ